jgi:hypothetical protein
MRTLKIAVLCMLLGVAPAWSDEVIPDAGQELDQSEDFPGPEMEPVPMTAPTRLYVPLTAEQEELPTWTKPIKDRLPATE